ncbi:MAG: hypothetical protein CMB80_25675 [Flammeovirgaceae bacterium]|nr:hypothetical protein [Flammeovirgaceae bacterium]MBE62753.1 hypothetical protein [Flammeovirgaceae bacterium]MBR09963.1 hypothetical protein [Rickettsiales bacterium]HCX22072.1 hypothetical protein [Cytophagales bacterium]|tara:strand:- start:4380 stop:5039 length:660 start_codon:yes stop_codon:yes gene_type:complete
MEKATSNKRKKSVTAEQFKQAYIEEVLTTGQNPPSVFAFAKGLKSSEKEFYNYFNSFRSLERSIWADWLQETVKAIENDEAYTDYSVREKLLAFYYTWLETLKEHRSFVLKRFEETPKTESSPFFLDSLKQVFEEFLHDLILEGKDTSEIMERPFSNQYSKAFWLHFLFISRFWANDDSTDFEKTDAAIEKSVNLAFDLVGKGPLDSMIDFAKFMFQQR